MIFFRTVSERARYVDRLSEQHQAQFCICGPTVSLLQQHGANAVLPLSRGDDYLDWWTKVLEYLKQQYDRRRYGEDIGAFDVPLPGLESSAIVQTHIEPNKFLRHDLVACLYDTTRKTSSSSSRTPSFTSVTSSTNAIRAHEFGQSLRLLSVLQRLFDLLPWNTPNGSLYTLDEMLGVVLQLGRVNQTRYYKDFWRIWWENERGHASQLLVAHNLGALRRDCYKHGIFQSRGKDPATLRQRDLRLMWAAAQAVLFFREEIPRHCLTTDKGKQKEIGSAGEELRLFNHADEMEESIPPVDEKNLAFVKGGMDKTFNTAHLSADTLRELGAVELRGTYEFGDHLKFEHAGETGHRVLRVFWDAESIRRTRLHVKLLVLSLYIPPTLLCRTESAISTLLV